MRRRSSDLQAGRVSLDLSLPALPAARTGGGSTESQGWSGKCSVNPEGVGPRGVSGSPKQSGRTCGGWAVPGEDGRTSPAVWQRQVSWSCCPWRGQRGEGAGACQGRSGAWSGERGRTAGGGVGGDEPLAFAGWSLRARGSAGWSHADVNLQASRAVWATPTLHGCPSR